MKINHIWFQYLSFLRITSFVVDLPYFLQQSIYYSRNASGVPSPIISRSRSFLNWQLLYRTPLLLVHSICASLENRWRDIPVSRCRLITALMVDWTGRLILGRVPLFWERGRASWLVNWRCSSLITERAVCQMLYRVRGCELPSVRVHMADQARNRLFTNSIVTH